MYRKETSFGIIPVRFFRKKWQILLIRHQSGHWSFPKGHANLKETPKETAERELNEEVGLSVVYFFPQDYKEHYFFTWNGQKIDKTVEYFQAMVKGKITIQEDEISDARWLNLDEAENRSTFPEAKRICREVKASLESYKDGIKPE
jgi:bis(5'-nucleosidyl)-tetraphosphatase